MMESITNMRTVVELCRGHRALPESLSTWLASSLESFLDKKADSLNDAFGVRNLRGGVPWRMEANMRTRDAALRELASRHYGELSVTARASRIQQLAERYAASSWRFDRDRAEMPSAYRGTPHEFLWRAFKSGAAMPLCERQLRKIVGP
jgi:hypothetical protein